MFAHRLGLIPINLDPRKLEWRQGGKLALCIKLNGASTHAA